MKTLEAEVPLTLAERRLITRLSKQNAITPEEIVVACVKLGLPLVESTIESTKRRIKSRD